jgi:NADH dehydrogenase [ubiquinone] 1 alpha subcomplex assembly factor 7
VSALEDHLESMIRMQGPLTVARFMAEALGHPKHGYYMGRDPLGRGGDFVTAPEISQMFGELLGLWVAATWEAMGRPASFKLVELGPGRGTLMADALRAAKVAPGLLAAAELHLVETSPTLRQRQRQALGEAGATWHERFMDVPEGALVLLANEFFDALPVQQFQRTEHGWCERLVDIGAVRGANRGADRGADRKTPGQSPFRLVLSPRPTPSSALIPSALGGAPLGSVGEVCASALTLARDIGSRVWAHGGAALIVDYGRATSAPGDSLQAVRGHGSHPWIEAPGSADITAHVDFETLGRVASEAGAQVHGPIGQGDFLERLGIEARAAALLEGATPAQRIEIAAALGRLTDPSQMGSLFKVLAISHPKLPRPAGFEPAT